MADKKEKKTNNKDRRGALKEIAFAMFPNTYRLVNDYISKKNGEPSEWNKSVFKSFDPIGSRGQAIPGLAKLIYNYAIGNFDDVRDQDNSDELPIRVADAAWRKYNNIPYDKSLIIDNGDGTFRLPDEISKRIRTRRSEIEKSLDINKRKYKELRDAHYRRRRRLLDNVDYEGYLNEEREWKNDKDALMYSAAIMMDMDNLMGMDSVLNGKTGLFNEFNYRNRNIRKDGENGSAGPLNVLGNFHIGQQDGKFYYYDTFDLASGKDFGFIDQLSGGTPFKIKGRIEGMDVSRKNDKNWDGDEDMDIIHPAFQGPGVKEILRWADGGTVHDSYSGLDDWTSEDLFNPAYSRQSYTASSQKARDGRFKNELAEQRTKGFTDYVVPAITNTADFIPLVGEVKSAADAVNAYIEGNPGAAALYAMGALPAAGIMSRGSSIIGKAGSKVLKKYSNGIPTVANAVAEIVNQPKKLYNAVKWAIDDIGENGMRKFSEMVPFSARSTSIADKKSAESVKAGIEWLEDYYKHPIAQEKIRKIREGGDVAYSPERMEALKRKGLLNEDGTPNYKKWMESIPVEVGSPSALMDSKVVGFHTPIESANGTKDVIFNRMGPFYVNPDGLKYVAAHEDNHAMQEIFGLDNWEKVANGYAGANTDTEIGKMFDAVRNKATENEWYNSPSELHSKLIEWKMKNGLNAGDEITFRHMSDLASDSIFSKFLDFDNADWGDIKNLLNALPVALPVAGVGAFGAYATSGDGGNSEQMFANGGSVSEWKPSKEILDFVLETEKFRPKIYKDGNGIETIGYGFTDPKLIKKYRGKSMSRKEALRIFFNEKVPEFSRYVADSTENFDKLNDDQKDALFSYVYNIGVGKYKKNYPKLHKALKNEDWSSAAFNMDAGYNDEKNKGLRDRRNYERLLFGYYSDDNGNVYPLGEYDTGVKIIQDSAHKNKNILELMDPMTSTYMEAYNAAKLRGDKKFKYGKKQYPVKYDDGGTVENPDDIVSRKDNTAVANLAPQIILSDEIGGNLPYEAGSLPEVVVKSDLTGKKLERALNLAGARRGRNYVYQSQNEVMDPILSTFENPAVQIGMSFLPFIGDAMDMKDLINSAQSGDKAEMLVNAFAFMPIVGDITKKARAARKVKKMTKRELMENDYDALVDYLNLNSYGGYSDLPDISDIKTEKELDDLFKREIERHRTFARGVVADEKNVNDYLFGLAPVENNRAGRYGVRDDVSTKTGYNYMSNSEEQAMGYATGYGYNGNNGYIGYAKVGKPVDYSSKDRLDWLDQIEFDYDIADKRVADELREELDYGSFYDNATGDYIKSGELYQLSDYINKRRGSKLTVDEIDNIISDVKKKYPKREKKAIKKDKRGNKGVEFDDDLFDDDFGEIGYRSAQPYIRYLEILKKNALANGVDVYGFKNIDDYYDFSQKYYTRYSRKKDEYNKRKERFIDDFVNDRYTQTPNKGIILGGVGDYLNYGLRHFIINDQSLIHPISIKRIEGADPNMYTRAHEGIPSDELSGKLFDDGGTAGDDGKISMDNYDIAYDYLVNERGISPQSAIAIMANLENESGMNAGTTNSVGAFGIQQWLGPRKSALLKRYGSNPNLRQQLEFLVDEYEGKGGVSGWNYLTKGKNLGTDRFNYYMYSKSDFDNAPTIEDATIAWNQGFGRPATWELNNERRIASAKRLASRFNIPYGVGSYVSGQATPKKKENVAAFQEEVSPAVVRNPGTVVLKKAKEQEPVKAEEHKSSYAKKVEEKSNKIAEQRMRDKAKMDFFNLVWSELNFRRV